MAAEQYQISANPEDIKIIDQAAKKDNRSRSSFLINAALEKARSLGVQEDAGKSE